MEINHSDRTLVCVLFPGLVKNDEKALHCLGGIRNISHVYSAPAKARLDLSFQPENPFVKKIFADNQTTCGVLLKVRVKKKKVNNKVQREVVSTSVFGRVNRIYRFESLSDFQFLPVKAEYGMPPRCIIEEILPSGDASMSFFTDRSAQAAPLFIVPSTFTRSDKPVPYGYTEKRYGEKKSEHVVGVEDILHRRIRSKRGKPVTISDFNLIDELPTEPHEYYLKQKETRKETYPDIDKEYEIVKKLFEERPIWSQNQIRYTTKIKQTSLKIILPCVSVYMRNGPWRMLWIRYGYDPRKQPDARLYQTLDFRLRHHAGVHSMVMTRDKLMHYKKSTRTKKEADAVNEEISEAAVYFRPGMAPSQRQVFYQYCDVKIPEVEEILAAEPPPGYLCHHKRGWLPPNTDTTCRDHIFRYVKNTLLASHSADLKLEQGDISDEGSNTEDDGSSSSDDMP